MAEIDKDKARITRQQRLSAAMRENLKRRKAQARRRAASEPKPAGEAGSRHEGPPKTA
jgi:hypothetical protein